jgi:hypothetical protein
MTLEQFAIIDVHPEGDVKWKRFRHIIRDSLFLLLINISISALWFGLVLLYSYLVFVKLYDVPEIGVSAFFVVFVASFNGGLTYTLGYVNVARKPVVGVAFFIAAGVHWLLLILWLVEGRRWDWLHLNKSQTVLVAVGQRI